MSHAGESSANRGLERTGQQLLPGTGFAANSSFCTAGHVLSTWALQTASLLTASKVGGDHYLGSGQSMLELKRRQLASHWPNPFFRLPCFHGSTDGRSSACFLELHAEPWLSILAQLKYRVG